MRQKSGTEYVSMPPCAFCRIRLSKARSRSPSSRKIGSRRWMRIVTRFGHPGAKMRAFRAIARSPPPIPGRRKFRRPNPRLVTLRRVLIPHITRAVAAIRHRPPLANHLCVEVGTRGPAGRDRPSIAVRLGHFAAYPSASDHHLKGMGGGNTTSPLIAASTAGLARLWRVDTIQANSLAAGNQGIAIYDTSRSLKDR